VGTQSADLQLCTPADKSPRYGNRIRCILSGLGSDPEGPSSKDGRPVVNRGAEAPHQLFGVDSRAAGSKIFCKGQERHQHPSKDRQHISQGYINHFAGTHSHPVNVVATEFWRKWCMQQD